MSYYKQWALEYRELFFSIHMLFELYHIPSIYLIFSFDLLVKMCILEESVEWHIKLGNLNL